MGLLNTPTSGKTEVVRALRGLAASDGRFVPPRRLRWVLGPRAVVADIATVLGELVAEDGPRVQADGDGGYCLTDAGVLFARASRPTRRFIDA